MQTTKFSKNKVGLKPRVERKSIKHAWCIFATNSNTRKNCQSTNVLQYLTDLFLHVLVIRNALFISWTVSKMIENQK